MPQPPPATLFPYTTLFRSPRRRLGDVPAAAIVEADIENEAAVASGVGLGLVQAGPHFVRERPAVADEVQAHPRSEEHTSERQISYAVFCLKKKTSTSSPSI